MLALWHEELIQFIVGNEISSVNSILRTQNGGSSVTASMGACGAPDAGSTPAYLPIYSKKLYESNEVPCQNDKAQESKILDATPAYLPITLTNTKNYKQSFSGDILWNYN